MNSSVSVTDKPFGMGVVEPGGPACMVDCYVNNNLCIAAVDCIDKFGKLLCWCSPWVKFRQGRVDGSKTKGRIRAPEPPHPGIGCWRGVDRKQLNNPAAQPADNKIQFLYQVPKCPGWRDYSKTIFVKVFNDLIDLCSKVFSFRLVRTELSYKCIINYIGATGISRFYVYYCVFPGRPNRFCLSIRNEITLCIKVANFTKTKCNGKSVVRDLF